MKLKLDLVDSEYDGELEELEKMERDYEKIWAKRPFKGYVPEEEQSEGYLKNKSRLEEIKEDLKLLANPAKINYRERYHALYDEFTSLNNEVRKSEGYRRIFGEKDPKDVDLSKGKLSEDLVKKIGRIKELWEERDKYKEMEEHMEMNLQMH